MAVLSRLFVEWIGKRLRSASWPLRIVYGLLCLVALVGIAFVAHVIPGLDELKDLFSRAQPEVQTGILTVLILVAVVAGFIAMGQDNRAERLEEEKERLKSELDNLSLKHAASEEKARQLEERWDNLFTAESRVQLWQRGFEVVPTTFVKQSNRRAKFVTVLNLKGGVGKTTLCANLAASLGLATPPLRVLLIDIDFQGTLGEATVDQVLREKQGDHRSYVNHLLTTQVPDDGLVPRLAVGMNQVQTVSVILATDTLDADEFELHAKFFVDRTAEPRLQFRMHLHRPSVYDKYDLVLFDCPPRVTTSVVNALFCSDWVLIPTQLDSGSIDAVPRTVNWLKSLGDNCQADVLGVIASHATVRAGNLTQADNKSYEALRSAVQSCCGEDLLFKAVIPDSPNAIGQDRGLVACLKGKGREVFAQVASEFRRRAEL